MKSNSSSPLPKSLTSVTAALLAAVLASPLACSSANHNSDDDDDDTSASHALVEAEWESYAPELQVRIASYTGSCALRQANADKENSTTLRISVEANSGATSVPAGTYPVGSSSSPSPGTAYAALNNRDATCSKDGPDSVSGTVTLTTPLGVTGAAAKGSYSIRFEDGSTLSGNFDASYCDTSKVTGTSTCTK